MNIKKCAILFLALLCVLPIFAADEGGGGKDYIKWVDFDIPSAVLEDAKNTDIETYSNVEVPHVSWIEILSSLGAKYGGNFKLYKKSDIEFIVSEVTSKISDKISSSEIVREYTKNKKLYDYYIRAYGAVLSGMLGKHTEFRKEDDVFISEEKYGMTAYSPIAENYYYSHFDDFGAARSYGYSRPHLGHDLLGSVGTPIIAIEGGYVSACGWNQYGGWRIGITSFDGCRYYYYAHLRKDHPYNDIYKGKIVNAGEVIGYLGMTGYSKKENVNNIDTPHLHFGLQIIFDKSQKDGANQIWIDLYQLTNFLSKSKTSVSKAKNGEYESTQYKVRNDTPD